MEQKILGKTIAKIFVVEFQKHKDACPQLYEAVTRHMMHGPGAVPLDNRWVVPYNPLLLQLLQCHINVEVVSSISVVKYLYKYVYKGPDMEPPQALRDLLSHDVARAKQFRQQIRAYNCSLQLASSTLKDSPQDAAGAQQRGLRSVRMHGRMYHRIGPLLPAEGQKRRFAQLWIYDATCDGAAMAVEIDDGSEEATIVIDARDKDACPQLYEAVTRHMMHGPCGTAAPQAPCMDGGDCTKRFPRDWQDETTVPEDGYPLYRRRNDGCTVSK
ncbi:hypothetical protein ABPG75_010051 [Micractinium tetrahymenae]